MKAAKWFFGIVLVIRLITTTDNAASQEPNGTRHGYVDCGVAKHSQLVPVFEHPCKSKPALEMRCGEPLELISRDGPWLKIKTADGSEKYIGFTSVSQSKKKFLAIDLPAPPGPYALDCSASWQQPPGQPGTHRPIVLYRPDPEYSDEARNAHIRGTVELSLTVGTDGIAHDIVVTKSLGHGLDEKALAAVRQWRFDPAAEDSKLIPALIKVRVDFRLY
jgi:TonB family protein